MGTDFCGADRVVGWTVCDIELLKSSKSHANRISQLLGSDVTSV